MKTLSLIQPYASLIALRQKVIETRSWSTDHRGPLAIHATKEFPRECRLLCWSEPFCSALKPAGWDPELIPEKVLPLGAIVAVCELVDVVAITSYISAMSVISKHLVGADMFEGAKCPRYGQETAFGDYSTGRYMWLLSNVRALPKPIPARGKLGLWETDLCGQSPVDAAAPAILAAAAADEFNRSKRGDGERA